MSNFPRTGPNARIGPVCVLSILFCSLLACAPGPTPGLQAALPAQAAATWEPTWTPPPEPTAAPTATWVPLPSPVPEGEGSLSRAGVPRLDAAEAWERVRAGEAVLVDVRPRALYTELHAAGAISMPLDELGDCYEQLPPKVTLIFYCA